MLRPIRRVITGHDAQGRSIIASDEASPNTIAISDSPAFGMTDLWVTRDAPADNAAVGDPAARKIVLEPPARGRSSGWWNFRRTRRSRGSSIG